MKGKKHSVAAAVLVGAETRGIIKVYFFDSPASMSIREEATLASQGPMIAMFNKLIMFDTEDRSASTRCDCTKQGS